MLTTFPEQKTALVQVIHAIFIHHTKDNEIVEVWRVQHTKIARLENVLWLTRFLEALPAKLLVQGLVRALASFARVRRNVTPLRVP